MGAPLLVETLRGLEDGTIIPEPQDNAAATFAPILSRDDGLVDWRLPATEVANRARGFLPWPGAWTWFRGQRFQIWRCRTAAMDGPREPGRLFASGRRLFVRCGEASALELVEVQAEGRKRVPAEAFLNGLRLAEIEAGFRTLKGVDLSVRPIRHRLETRVKAHILLSMLAYYVRWHYD